MSRWKYYAILVTTLFVVACGQVGGTTMKIVRMTKHDPMPTQVHVVRPSSSFSKLPPLDIMVKDRQTVLALYDQAFALTEITPPNGKTPMSCANELLVTYSLTFYVENQEVLALAAHPTGCPIVVLGSNDYRQPDVAFWSALATSIDGPVSDPS